MDEFVEELFFEIKNRTDSAVCSLLVV